jgi:two-component system nitrate/nitrite sensor histidine kinase NarX
MKPASPRRQPARVHSLLLWLLSLSLLGAAGLLLAAALRPAIAAILPLALWPVLGLALAAVLLLWRLRRQMLDPMLSLQRWAARLPVDTRGLVSGMLEDITALASGPSLLDGEAWRQSLQSLTDRARALEILHGVAAGVDASRDQEDLLTRFLHMLAEVTDASAATVRLRAGEDGWRLVAALGLDDKALTPILPLARLLPEHAAQGGVQSIRAVDNSDFSAGAPPGAACILVPVEQQGEWLGLYGLLVEPAAFMQRGDIGELLATVGHQLGLALHKARQDEEMQRLTISRERSMLAHELHDSLAQTLASLRFQVSTLGGALDQDDLDTARRERERLRAGLDKANTELRELLAHFRAPLDARGLLPALSGLIRQFQQETGVRVYFQRECRDPHLTAHQQLQVVRIVQEALANVRKHSEADAVRVLMRCDAQQRMHVLIEDDGIGFSPPAAAAAGGEHVGLDTMRERASRLGGELLVDSEEGEGTRITLSFPPLPAAGGPAGAENK